ncbi:hypothetical protein [Oceanobacillus piezotolerans]|nr:hypothetical protein [Oceanobacillus piezotolerans]
MELEQSYATEHKVKSFFYHPKWKYYHFQSFLNEQTKEKARIVELSKEEGVVLTDSGERIPLSELKQRGFIPLEHFKTQNIINKPGYVQFRFEQPASLHSFIYEVIESFYRSLGHKNMKITEADGYINVYVKPFLIKEKGEYYSLLEEHLVSGEITQRHNGILLDSGIERITIFPSTKQKQKLKSIADNKKLTILNWS